MPLNEEGVAYRDAREDLHMVWEDLLSKERVALLKEDDLRTAKNDVRTKVASLESARTILAKAGFFTAKAPLQKNVELAQAGVDKANAEVENAKGRRDHCSRSRQCACERTGPQAPRHRVQVVGTLVARV